MERKYYVYVLIDPRTNQPFYVGKGNGRRMFYHKSDAFTMRDGGYAWNKPVHLKIRDIVNAGLEIVYEKVLFNVTEAEALSHEKALIAKYGKVNDSTGFLLNLHKGGANPNGKTCKPVCQYTIDGEFVQEYDSAKKAGEMLEGANASYIAQCCQGKRVSSGGFVWAYKGAPPKLDGKKYWKAVHQKDPEGNIVATFRSLHEAAEKTGINVDNIKSNVRRKKEHYLAGGFKFDYV